nr:immunoglobulin heavy chain junction region [Mus musculus]
CARWVITSVVDDYW